MVLDVPPAARAALGDPTIPLFVTEGVKKADAAVSKGLCCVALLGVWNWRGTNGQGGKTALPDWESVALETRMVYVVFDSDVATKPGVRAALVRLKAFLEHRKAHASILYLPSGPGGTKVGLDDYSEGPNEDARSLAPIGERDRRGDDLSVRLHPQSLPRRAPGTAPARPSHRGGARPPARSGSAGRSTDSGRRRSQERDCSIAIEQGPGVAPEALEIVAMCPPKGDGPFWVVPEDLKLDAITACHGLAKRTRGDH
jgi:hypothetical protein